MALVEDPRSIYAPELGQDITFVYHAFFSGKMSGRFTLKILYKQHGDMDKVVFPYDYIITSRRDTICSFYGVADTVMAMVTASVHTMFPWLLQNAQSFSAALSLINRRLSSVNEDALKLKRSPSSGEYV